MNRFSSFYLPKPNLEPQVQESLSDIDSLGLSVRASNFLKGRFRMIAEVVSADSKMIIAMRGSGNLTLREVSQGLLRKFYKPLWLEDVARCFHYPEAELIDDDLEPVLGTQGWAVLAVYDGSQEYWMLENALATLSFGQRISYMLRRKRDGSITIFFKGGVYVSSPEDEGEESQATKITLPQAPEVIGPASQEIVYEPPEEEKDADEELGKAWGG